MAGPIFANNAVGVLAAAYSATATALTLEAGQGALFPSPNLDEWFPITIVNPSNEMEIAHCTARVGDTLTVTRGRENTIGRPLALGDRVEHRLTAGALFALKSAPISASQLADGSITLAKMGPGSVDGSKIVDGSITGADIAAGQIGSGHLVPGAVIDNIGFIPVQQGGGFGMTFNKVAIGWSEPYLRAQVDSTPLGYLLTLRDNGSPLDAGYRGLPVNTQNTTYTFGLSDAGKAVHHSLGDSNYIIPTDAAVPHLPGTVIKINNLGGSLSITPQAGVNLTWVPTGGVGGRFLAAPGGAVIEKVEPNHWWIYGVGLS